MTGVLYLAVRYLAFHRLKTAVLVLSLTLVFYLPAGLRVLVREGRNQLTARAAATPLLIGAQGSPLELVLNALYARASVPPLMEYREVEKVRETGLATPIPLYIRFRSQKDPIVGTTLDYFEFRGLRIAAGGMMARLGDCVAGAGVARRRGLATGSEVISSPESVFDITGVYPLKMRVTGVLARSDSPDDDALFVDLKTAWLIQGLAHGHQDLARPEAAGQVLRREGNTIAGNASVVEFNEVTGENIGSFHFHGDPATFPITAIVAAPRDQKTAALLMGRYEGSGRPVQMVRPRTVIEELLSTVLTVESFVVAALALAGAAALATAALVFTLSLRLRRREIETMERIGGSRAHVAGLILSEAVVVLGAAGAMAAALAWITGALGPGLIRVFLVE